MEFDFTIKKTKLKTRFLILFMCGTKIGTKTKIQQVFNKNVIGIKINLRLNVS
jgi:hypothetical protein